jgi:hypothetical protein
MTRLQTGLNYNSCGGKERHDTLRPFLRVLIRGISVLATPSSSDIGENPERSFKTLPQFAPEQRFAGISLRFQHPHIFQHHISKTQDLTFIGYYKKL